jgi:ATP-dependent DNA ligase
MRGWNIGAVCAYRRTVGPPKVFGVPPTVALARASRELPGPGAMPGGTLYEPKWDGFRVVVVVDREVTLWSRQGKDLTRSFPELSDAAAATIPAGCIVDGEAVVWIDGRLSFDALQQRLSVGSERARQLAHAQPGSFVAFDMLAVAGRDVRHLRFTERRNLLEHLAAEWTPPLTSLRSQPMSPKHASGWRPCHPSAWRASLRRAPTNPTPAVCATG